jgi:hypothetical protein
MAGRIPIYRRVGDVLSHDDYEKSAAHRKSYARRTGAERGFATAKDPASNDISRGWCRLMGLAPLMLFTTTLLIVRNQRIITAWNARQDENVRRASQGLPPKTRRRRRRTTLASLAAPRHEPRARQHAQPPAPPARKRRREHARNQPMHAKSTGFEPVTPRL